MPADPLLLLIGLGSTLGFGVAPRVAVGLTVDGGIHYAVDAGPFDGFSLSVGVRWDPPASRSIPLFRAYFPDEQVTSSRFLGVGAPCVYVLKVIFACGLIEAGNLHLSVENVSGPAEGDRQYFALGGRLGVEVPFAQHVGFRGFGEALQALTYDEAYINHIPVYTSPPHSDHGRTPGSASPPRTPGESGEDYEYLAEVLGPRRRHTPTGSARLSEQGAGVLHLGRVGTASTLST